MATGSEEPTGQNQQPASGPARPGGADNSTPPTSVPPSATPGASGAPGAPAASGPVPPLTHKTPWTAYIRPVAWTLLAIYVITFVFLNRETVNINFLAFTASMPLIFVLLGMALIGAALCAGIMMMVSRRSTKKAELTQLKATDSKGKK